MRVSKRWIEWAHGPGADDGQELAGRLVTLAESTKDTAVTLTDAVLVAEVVDVAGLYHPPCRGDALYDMGPWWLGQPRKIIKEGREFLHAHAAASRLPSAASGNMRDNSPRQLSEPISESR